MRCPSGSPFGQKREAMPRLITATRAESTLSASRNTRQAIEEIFNASKKSGLAICKSAEGTSLVLSAVWPSIIKGRVAVTNKSEKLARSDSNYGYNSSESYFSNTARRAEGVRSFMA